MVLLDQSAAFDTIDHDKLLDCLRNWFAVGGMLHILDTILVHCILHILGTILVHCLI